MLIHALLLRKALISHLKQKFCPLLLNYHLKPKVT